MQTSSRSAQCARGYIFAAVKNTIQFFLLVSSILLFFSCSVEKRRYTDGFHVEWRLRDKSIQNDAIESSAQNETIQANDTIVQKSTVSVVEPEVEKSENTKVERAIEEKEKPISIREQSGNIFRSTHFLRQFIRPVIESKSNAISQTSVDPSLLSIVGSTFGMIGFILAILAILSFLIAILVADGWAALGWIAIAVAFGVATIPFTAIAQGIFWYHHQGVPWFQWPGILVSLMGIYVLIRILIPI